MTAHPPPPPPGGGGKKTRGPLVGGIDIFWNYTFPAAFPVVQMEMREIKFEFSYFRSLSQHVSLTQSNNHDNINLLGLRACQ